MKRMHEADVDKIIKDLQGNFAADNSDQMAGVEMLKGLATSDDPKANEFMKALDKATTQISKDVLNEAIIIEKEVKIGYLILEPRDKIKIKDK